MNSIVQLPMNSEEIHLSDKKCDYKTLATMMLYSNMTPKEILYEQGLDEVCRFIYKEKIEKNIVEIESLTKNKKDTIIKNIRKLSKLNNRLVMACKNKDGKIFYVINYADTEGKKFVTIEEEILRYLIDVGNSNVIKTYILLKYLCKDGERKITRKYIAENIGLSSKSKGNLQTVTNILTSLDRNGLINRRYEYMNNNTNNKKCNIYYSINSYETWKKNL